MPRITGGPCKFQGETGLTIDEVKAHHRAIKDAQRARFHPRWRKSHPDLNAMRQKRSIDMLMTIRQRYGR